MFTQKNSGNATGVMVVPPNQNPGSVLGNNEIRAAIVSKRIVCHPFIEQNIQTSSIDVTLGHFYYRELNHSRIEDGNVNLQMSSELRGQPIRIYSCDKIWSDNFQIGKDLVDALNEVNCDTGNAFLIGNSLPESSNSPNANKYIVLRPKENILGHTNEFIGTTKGSSLTSMCQTKSTVGRSLIETCKCAGWGDVGYFNRWTLEITNNSNKVVILQTGQPIAQIVFLTVYGCSKDASYTKKGAYQVSDDFQEVICTWTPEMMLPKSNIKHL